MRRTALFLAALALAGAAGCSGDAAPKDAATVEMLDGHRFAPRPLRVVAGTKVTFDNASSEAHTVTAYEEALPGDASYFASGEFESEDEARDNIADGIVGQEQSYEFTFDVPGTYEFFCIPHEDQGMKGTIVVDA